MNKSMKIYLPTVCKDLNLSDRQKVFCWLMLETSHVLHRKDWYTFTYNFYKKDIAHILQSQMGSNKTLENKYADAGPYRELNEIFNFSFINNYSLLVSWKKYKKAGRNGQLVYYSSKYIDEIKDPNVIPMFMYLLGRYSGGNIFSEDTTILRKQEGLPASLMINKMYESFHQNYELR